MFSTPRTAGHAAFPKQGTGNREQGTGKTHTGAVERFCGWFIPAWSGAFVLLALVDLLACPGCSGPGLASPVFHDVKELLSDPAVQSTLQNWTANADLTNPALGFYFVTGGEIRSTGVVMRATANGAGKAGVDPTLLAQLTEIAAKYQQAKTQGALSGEPQTPPAETPAPAAPQPATP